MLDGESDSAVGIVSLIALDCDLNPAKEPQASFHSPDLQPRVQVPKWVKYTFQLNPSDLSPISDVP